MRNFRPMFAMSLDWHLTCALDEYGFAKVSDKLRSQLVEQGMPPREASIKAPVMLDGMDRALQQDFDFKRIRDELKAEQRDGERASSLVPDGAG